MVYSNRFSDGHTHDKKNTSPKGFPQCSKCGKLSLSKTDMANLRSRKKSTSKGSKRTKSTSKSHKNTSKRTTRTSNRGSSGVGSEETVQGRLPQRINPEIPTGSINQKAKTPDFVKKMEQKHLQGTLTKMSPQIDPEIKNGFRKIIRRK